MLRILRSKLGSDIMRYPNMLATMAKELRSSIEYPETNPYFAFCKSLFSRFLFYKNSSSTKLALAILLSLGVTIVSACNTIAGAYSDDPYGPVVDCDSKLPMNELLKCVDKEYEMMDKIHMTPHQKTDRKWAKIYSEGEYKASKRFYFPDTYKDITYDIVPQFNSIKQCYKKDKCQMRLLPGYIHDVSYDDYKGRGIAIEHSDSLQTHVIRSDKKCEYNTGVERLKNCKIMRGSGVATMTYRHFTRSYRNRNKDIIFFEDNGMNIFMGSLEFVRLSDKKTLVGIRIFEFHPLNPVKDGFILKGNVYERESPGGGIEGIHKYFISERFSPYAAFTVWDIRDEDIKTISDNFALSLDKRENPSKLYINTGNKVYEISIPKGKEN